MLILSALFGGAFAGILAGLLGIGGGLVFIPLMMSLAPGLGIHTIIATSTGFTLCTSSSAFLAHSRTSPPLTRVLPFLLCGSLCGALIGPHIMLAASRRVLTLSFAVVVMLPFAMGLLRLRLKPAALPLTLSGVLIGALAAIFGIGGGALMVPVLKHIFAQDLRRAITTSALFIMFNSTIATGVYAFSGVISWPALALAAPAGIAGSLLGSHLSHKTSPRLLTLGLALISALIVVRMVFST